MGLRKPTFEGQENVQDNAAATAAPTAPTAPTAPVADPATPAANAANASTADPAAAPSESTAVAAPKATAMAVGSKYTPACEGFRNLIDPSSLDFDTFRRITVGLDGFSDDKEVELGKKVKIQLMSFNERFICSPGKQDAESNELVRYSLDGKTIDETGQPCAEYIKNLQEVEGYTEAALKKYLNIYGFLVATAKAEDSPFVEIDPVDREIVSIQVPPRSVSKFTRFQIEDGVKVAQKLVEETDTIVLTQHKVKGATTNYAEISFGRK